MVVAGTKVNQSHHANDRGFSLGQRQSLPECSGQLKHTRHVSTCPGAQADFVMLLPEAAASPRHKKCFTVGTMAAASRDGRTDRDNRDDASEHWSFIFLSVPAPRVPVLFC